MTRSGWREDGWGSRIQSYERSKIKGWSKDQRSKIRSDGWFSSCGASRAAIGGACSSPSPRPARSPCRAPAKFSIVCARAATFPISPCPFYATSYTLHYFHRLLRLCGDVSHSYTTSYTLHYFFAVVSYFLVLCSLFCDALATILAQSIFFALLSQSLQRATHLLSRLLARLVLLR